VTAQPDLFEVGPRVPPSRKRSQPTPAPIGSGPEGETCKTCRHACAAEWHGKRYWKCRLAPKWTHGGGTDIRLRWAACYEWAARAAERNEA
jgi:hypothetical protein